MSKPESLSPSRQLLIGLDAADWDLVSRWAGEGKLPTFRRLIEQGTHAVLSSTAAQLPDTVWASVVTGMNPAKFEKFFYVQYDARTQDLQYRGDDTPSQPGFWQYLGQGGQRVGVVDVPHFPLDQPVGGFQINWGAHATHAPLASEPQDLFREIEKRFGRHPVGDCDAVDDTPRQMRELRRRLLAGVRRHGELNRWLMRERPWDVFFTCFSETHCAGHLFWRYLTTSPKRSEEDAHELDDTLEQVYQAIDAEIAEMLLLAGEGVQCLVFSGHGMGPLRHASWHLQEILDLWGYGRDSSPPKTLLDANGQQKEAVRPEPRVAQLNPWMILKRVTPGWLQYRIKAMLPQELQHQLLFRLYAGGRNWKGCRAFAIPNNDSVGAVRIAVTGRDRYGVVAAGDEYRRVCCAIAQALTELTDPHSGRPVVKQVTLTHEEFHGPFLNQLPDLTVLWDSSFSWEAVHSPRFGALRLRQQDRRSGSHTSYGFALATGASIPAGGELIGHSILDIAPTILHWAGVPVPPSMDGRVLPLGRGV